MEVYFSKIIEDLLVLSFDEQAATLCAEFRAKRRQMGRPIKIQDAMIAGIAQANGCTVATRNTSDFENWIVPVLNPWTLSKN